MCSSAVKSRVISELMGDRDGFMLTDTADRKLIGLLQRDFPLAGEPFSVLGEAIGLTTEETITRVRQFKESGLIRQIGPVIEARKLGRHTTLAAFKLGQKYLESAERRIREHPAISHAYQRQHDFNIWITMTAPSELAVGHELTRLKDTLNADDVVDLPVVKLYKIGFFLDLDDEDPYDVAPLTMDYGRIELDKKSGEVLNALQRDLPLVARPFDDMADEVGLTLNTFLGYCHKLVDAGVVRRFGAAVNHRKAGYIANAMTCWAVPEDLVDSVGRYLSSCREVSHCYERKTSSGWDYNIFAMIHGRRQQECLDLADKVTGKMGLGQYQALFSTREIKKARVKYII